jgi:hypothetical protein
MIKSIVDALQYYKEHPGCQQLFAVRPYTPLGIAEADPRQNQFLVFLKPEALTLHPTVRVDRVLEVFFDHLRSTKITTGAVSVLPASYLREFNIIQANYRTLNRVSLMGMAAISAQVAARLKDYLCERSTLVRGGHEYLEEQPEITSLGLCLLVNQCKSVKLGAGVYAATIDYFGRNHVILNGFHPYQVETLTAEGTGVVAVECWAQTPFLQTRNQLIGNIDPHTAPIGSLRRRLADDASRLGLKNLSVQFNLVHVSPGPVEAAFQLKYFFSDFTRSQVLDVASTNMGSLLAEVSPQIVSILNNQHFSLADSNLPLLFASTEELDTREVLRHPLTTAYRPLETRFSVKSA